MNVTPTPGIAAAWSAAKASPNEQATQMAGANQPKAAKAAEETPEPKKSPPPPEGQGTRVDVRV